MSPVSGPEVDWLEPADYPEWRLLVARAATGSTYALPEYLGALSAAAGGDFRILGVRQGDELVAGLPVYRRNSLVRPRLLLYYNGFVLTELSTRYPSERAARTTRLVAALLDALAAERLQHVELRTRAPFADARALQARGFGVEPSYTYVVPLDDLPGQWERVEQNLRRLVRRAERDGIVLDGGEDFDSFFALHRQTHERTGAPLYLPEAAFRTFVAELRRQDLCRLYQARTAEGEVAASQLVLLGPHPVTHTVTAGTDRAHARSGAAAFLRWKVFEDLAGRGFRGNDLTDASLGPVAHFKSQLGGELQLNLVATRSTRAGRAVVAARRVAAAARGRLGRIRG